MLLFEVLPSSCSSSFIPGSVLLICIFPLSSKENFSRQNLFLLIFKRFHLCVHTQISRREEEKVSEYMKAAG